MTEQDALKNPLYETTRQAWETIWDNANVAQEVATMSYARSQRTVRQYTAFLNKEDIILEAGSGLSAALVTLRDMGYRVIGVDYALNALRASLRYDASLQVGVADVHTLPFAENGLGAYLSFGVLEHFEHGMRPALQEAFRVLKKDGVLVMTIPYPNLVWKLAQWKRNRAGKQRIDEDFYESTYTREQLISECRAVGFDVLETYTTSHEFTFWGVHRIFRGEGYYRTSWLANAMGAIVRVIAPWQFNYMTLVIARKP